MEIDIRKNIYLYGACSGKYDSEDDKKNKIVVYTTSNISIFDNIPLSSLEGIFVSDDYYNLDKENYYNLDKEKRLNGLIPQVYVKRDKMQAFEKKYLGKFHSFEK